MEKPRARLENWSVVNGGMDPWAAPELQRMRAYPALRGEVYNHPYYRDGKGVVTSGLKTLDPDKKIAETHNTIYKLGEINPEFVEFMNEHGYSMEEYVKSVEIYSAGKEW